mgnify:CR=1 FL=1|jgi:hypothetical protein
MAGNKDARDVKLGETDEAEEAEEAEEETECAFFWLSCVSSPNVRQQV